MSRRLQHYARLGLRPPVSRTELANAYRAEALRVHPDRGGDAKSFSDLRESYEALLAEREYAPASTRAFRVNSGRNRGAGGIIALMVVPVTLAAGISINVLYSKGESVQLRAGGASRFDPNLEVEHRTQN